MFRDNFPNIIIAKKKQIFQTQKVLLEKYKKKQTDTSLYIMFHKRVGKGSWVKYVERYKIPRSIENTQRLIFNYEGSYSEKKLSCSWQWMLPKKIAQSTTSDEVLNVWVYYRHKRKKAYHYMKVLKRLVDVGTCSTSDWRFKLITSRIQNKINTFLNLPRICYYYGRLKATAQLENIIKILNHRLTSYMPHQLILILKAFSLCKLQDKYLFNRIRGLLQPHIKTVPFYYLTLIVESYSFCLIHDYLFFNQIANEIIYRLNLCNNKYVIKSDDHYDGVNALTDEIPPNVISEKEGSQNRPVENGYEHGHNFVKDEKDSLKVILETDYALIKYKQEHFNYYPSMKNLIDISYFFSNLKFQHYLFFDYISMYIMYMLRTDQNCLTPYLIEKAVSSFYKLKINDIILFEHILKHIDIYIYDYPPSVLCSIGFYFSSILPVHYSEIYKIFKKIFLHVQKYMNILNLDSLTKYCCLIHKGTKNKKIQKEILSHINEEIKRNDNKNDKVVYDIPRIIEILSFHNCIDEDSFTILCKHLHIHLKHFEPCDFNRVARALLNVKIKQNIYDEKIINAIARNVIKHHDLFHIIDYHQTIKSLLKMNVVKDIYKIYLIKHHINVPFYGFDELKIDTQLPKEVKKSVYRYKKGTIYFSNKKIEQEYPLYKSIEG
ncbi:conserved Plasmodium protein, unknown function [Plasmodium malariae]|uniref:Uncharacterized protein n=1 Tax=Plasmodium malariae TaxID=5858 RepID=A0A1A8WR38_PLAMA|nr:conserved Plasmodium protein, unknown function [Plasmodium malariae]